MAKPTAAPMNGAVHGVAATVASAPVKNDPASPPRSVSRWPSASDAPADHDHARQRQPHGEQHVGEERHEPRRLELKAPSDLLATGAQRDHRPGEHGERGQHADGVGPAVGGEGRAPAAGMSQEGHRLHGKHGEHARHQVEEEPAGQRQGERPGHGAVAPLGGGRAPGAEGKCVDRAALVEALGDDQDAVDRRVHPIRQRAAGHSSEIPPAAKLAFCGAAWSMTPHRIG